MNSLSLRNFFAMDKIFATIFFYLLAIGGKVSSICVRENDPETISYHCVAGFPRDLNVIADDATIIHISNMTMSRVTRETFSRFGDNLWVLSCTHCGIREIDDGAFVDLTNLQQLRMDNNRLREIKSSWFGISNDLTYLDFNFNEIETIDDDIYAKFPSLVDFRISGNRLRCLNVEAMSNLDGLKRIFVSENPEFLCPNAVSKFLDDRGIEFDKDPKWINVTEDAKTFSRVATSSSTENRYSLPSTIDVDATSGSPMTNYPTERRTNVETTEYTSNWDVDGSENFEPNDDDAENFNRKEIYGQTNYYPAEISRSSTIEPVVVSRGRYEYPSTGFDEVATLTSTTTRPVAIPSLIEWSGYSTETFDDPEHPFYVTEHTGRSDDSTSTIGYSSVGEEIDVAGEIVGTTTAETIESTTKSDDDVFSQRTTIDNYQIVPEPNFVTIPTPTQGDSRALNAGFSVNNRIYFNVFIAICLTVNHFATIL